MSSETTVPVLVRLPPELQQRLKNQAAWDDRSMSAAVRVAIREYIEKREGNRQ